METRFGKYRLLDRLAVGGMAELYLAVENPGDRSQRFVTIKRIRPDHIKDPDYAEFFVTEGRIALKCAHPNLPQTFEVGEIDGVQFLAMEFIRGHTLLDVLRATYAPGTHLSVASVVRVGVEVAAALEYIHELRDVDGKPLEVVHRDVTPQNVMITGAGSVKLIDFGIVRSALQTHTTEVGVVKGKFAYISPEQLRPGRHPDRRADLFSLGIVLHESLTGRSLFRATSQKKTLERIKKGIVPDVCKLRPDVPPQLSAVILKALERDPKRRFQTATELLAALEEVAEECRIHHSMTKLRDEVVGLCGEPIEPAHQASIVARLASECGVPESKGRAPDAALAYFLHKGAITIGSRAATDDER